MKLAIGGGSGGLMAEMMAKTAACELLNSDMCSTNSECQWDADDHLCHLSTRSQINMMLRDCSYFTAQLAQECHLIDNSSACKVYRPASNDSSWDDLSSLSSMSASAPFGFIVFLALWFLDIH